MCQSSTEWLCSPPVTAWCEERRKEREAEIQAANPEEWILTGESNVY